MKKSSIWQSFLKRLRCGDKMIQIEQISGLYWKTETDTNEAIKKIYSNGGEVINIIVQHINKMCFVTIVYKEN